LLVSLVFEAFSVSVEPIGEGIQLRCSPMVETHPVRNASERFGDVSEFGRTVYFGAVRHITARSAV
jgi:hypothetical protein